MIEKLRTAHEAFFAWLERRRLHRMVFAIGWTTVLFAAVLGSVRTTFRANDNSGILAMCEDGLEAPFMSPILVRILGGLYQGVSDTVPWYGIACYASLFWGLALLIHALSTIRAARFVLLPLTLLCSTLFLSFLLRCGYNSSSILLSGVAVLAFVTYLRAERTTKTAVAMCALGLAFAFLFRPRGTQGALVFIAPAIAVWLVPNRRTLPLALILAFVAPIAVVGTVHVIWRTSFLSEEYRAFRDFNRLRGKFHAYPIAVANLDNQEILEANNWSANEYQLFGAFVFPDEDVWNLETISNIFDLSVEVPARRDAVDNVWMRYHMFVWWLPLALAGVFLRPSRRLALMVVGYVVYAGSIALVMEWSLRFPSRIGEPLLSLVAIGIAWLILTRDPEVRWSEARTRKIAGWLFAVCAAVPLVSWSALHVGLIGYTHKRANQFAIMTRWLNDWFEDRHLFAQPAILLNADQDPLEVYDDRFRLIPGGWQTFSPRYYAHLREIGLERGADILPFAIDNPEFFFAFSEMLTGRLVLFIRRQYGVQVRVRDYPGLGNIRFRVFQLVTDHEPLEDGESYHVDTAETNLDVGPRRRR